jgi:hypothetical protein
MLIVFTDDLAFAILTRVRVRSRVEHHKFELGR